MVLLSSEGTGAADEDHGAGEDLCGCLRLQTCRPDTLSMNMFAVAAVVVIMESMETCGVLQQLHVCVFEAQEYVSPYRGRTKHECA